MEQKIYKKSLKVGSILPIYLNFKEKKIFRGNAILLERLKNRESSKDQTRYEFAEISYINSRGESDKAQVLYNYQWWLIKFIDGDEVNFQTAVRISYYEKTYYQVG